MPHHGKAFFSGMTCFGFIAGFAPRVPVIFPKVDIRSLGRS